MQWRNDRWDYVPWLEERLFPGDLARQSPVAWAVYAESFDLTYDTEQDLAALRAHLNREEGGQLFHN